MSHTPGPWKAKRGNRGASHPLYVTTAVHQEALLPWTDEDAMLIAAAPDLLKRLKVMCQEWREIVGTPENNSTPGDCLELAEAVIAKAEGR